jgi:hypothetical protein
LEVKLDAFMEEGRRWMAAQDAHNKAFYKNRDKVERMEAKANIIAAIGVTLSSVIAGVIALVKGG